MTTVDRIVPRPEVTSQPIDSATKAHGGDVTRKLGLRVTLSDGEFFGPSVAYSYRLGGRHADAAPSAELAFMSMVVGKQVIRDFTLPTMPWGKHCDEPLWRIDSDYLRWVLRSADHVTPRLREDIQAELDERHRVASGPGASAGAGTTRLDRLRG